MNTEPLDLEKNFDRVFPCLNEEEQDECLILSFTGLPVHEASGITIYMSSEAFENLRAFQLKMVHKYD